MTLQGPPVAIAPTGTSWWQHAVLAGRRAVVYELHSLARSMLDLTIGYAEQRHQFGRPIGSFQAVRHQLAEVFVAVESAGLALGESWEQPDPWQVALTKSLAGAAHALASNTCLQVHGAIGFTAEYDLHRFIRRGWVLDLILGSTRELDAAAGLAILESHTVPRVGTLVDSHV
jgi:alkylation response protein AidB-like acyl-CoA dehydrogenase